MAELDFDGERLVPGKTVESLFRESQMRYAFAGRFAKGKVVLDLASGVGIGTDYLRRTGAVRSVGVDLSAAAVEYAKSHYPDCQFAVGDAVNPGLADQSVDLIVSFETIEHLISPGDFLAQCKRILRPNGVLVCSTPNREISQWGPGNPFHTGEMTTQELLNSMKKYFVDCEVFGQKVVHYPAFVARSFAARMLDKVGLKTAVGRSVRRFKPLHLVDICNETEFSEPNGHYAELGIYPHVPSWRKRPTYVVVKGRKAAPSGG
jgi:SAM-dependent methyltransferase